MIWFLDDLPADAPAGGKARTLARLVEAGFPVPRGFVITAAAFDGERLVPQAWDEVRRKAGHLKAPYAVRSSATEEDSATSSFAGGFETVLDVAGPEALLESIHSVFRSRGSERAGAYARARGVEGDGGMSVIVQTMVSADYAGVLFTADPVDGDRRRMVGRMVPGVGDRLLAGDETGEGFRLALPRGRYDGPPAFRRHGRSLFRLARRVARALGGPQDIEWAVRGRRTWILQARPISTMRALDTTTGIVNHTRCGDYLWSNVNIGEALPGVMTPLTWSFVEIMGQEAFTDPMPGEHPLLGNVAGHAYVNLSRHASVMRSLGLDRSQIEGQSKGFLGSLPDGIEIPLVPHTRLEVLRHVIPHAFASRLRMRKDVRDLPSFLTGIPSRASRVAARLDAANSSEDLTTVWHDDLEPLMRRVFQVLGSVSSWCEGSQRPLRLDLVERVGEEAADLMLSGVGTEGEELSSLGPLLGLHDVARGRRSREEYIRTYGHRSADEYELSEPRPHEDPHWLERQLELLAGQDPLALLEQRRSDAREAWARYDRQFPGEVEPMRARAAAAAAAARAREAVRSECARVAGSARAFALRAGDMTGVADGVFFLFHAELLDMLRGQAVPRGVIERRRNAYLRLKELPPYPTLIRGRFDPFEWAASEHRRSDVFGAAGEKAADEPTETIVRGLPASTGVVEGRVRCLRSPEQGHLLQPGEILVAVATNVGWTPTFPRVAAIVTDVGAPLSHAAIVARELGIPAVVGTRTGTRVLQDGDLVRVDGARGTVERISARS